MLEIESLYFAYEKTPVLDEISFSVAKGEIIALIGVSGSGKTTLFRLITGLLKPNRGTITIADNPLPLGTQLTTYMRQEDLLLPWRTVLENLLLFTEIGKKPKKKRQILQEEAYCLLKRVGLEKAAKIYPNELSGGMRQRVALARTLLQNRPLILLDEPFASLDVIIREQLYMLMREIPNRYAKTIVMVTHDFRDAIALADRIFVLSRGKIVASYVLNSVTRTDPYSCNKLTKNIREHLSLGFA